MKATLAVCAAAALIATAVAMAAPPREARPPAGFDHPGHASALSQVGAEPVPCAACHELDRAGRLVGVTGHDACFGACHGPAPRPPRRGRAAADSAATRDRLAVCEACHSPASLRSPRPTTARQRPGAAAPPPARRLSRMSDFRLTLSHRTHNSAGADRCRDCHSVSGKGVEPKQAHRRCVKCHGGAPERDGAVEPRMAACGGCHANRTTGSGEAAAPLQVGGPLAASVVFSHARHLERQGGCIPCHAEAAQADGAAVPRPGKARCRTCHNGSDAFSTIEPRCRACHEAPADPPDRPRLHRAPYSHARHALLGVGEPCAQCHELDPKGAPQPAARAHTPCAQSACHADEFSARAPAICGACHVGTAPWRPLHAEAPPRRTRDFTVAFSHPDHLATGKPAAGRDCNDCHGANAAPHRACSGNACHSGERGPSLEACGQCHRDALATTARRPWSVAGRFSHQSHRTGLDGQTLACERCHGDVTDGPPRPPGKATCAPCHDGTAAFKMTGHGCARCHRPGLTGP